MADNRKVFRPRRLAFGGRSLPVRVQSCRGARHRAAAIGPASAQDAGLKNGAASLSAGKYDAAVRQLSGDHQFRQCLAGRCRQGALSPRDRLSQDGRQRPRRRRSWRRDLARASRARQGQGAGQSRARLSSRRARQRGRGRVCRGAQDWRQREVDALIAEGGGARRGRGRRSPPSRPKCMPDGAGRAASNCRVRNEAGRAADPHRQRLARRRGAPRSPTDSNRAARAAATVSPAGSAR